MARGSRALVGLVEASVTRQLTYDWLAESARTPPPGEALGGVPADSATDFFPDWLKEESHVVRGGSLIGRELYHGVQRHDVVG